MNVCNLENPVGFTGYSYKVGVICNNNRFFEKQAIVIACNRPVNIDSTVCMLAYFATILKHFLLVHLIMYIYILA